MNLESLFTWVVGIVIALSSVGKLDVLQKWVWQAQAKVIHESRSSELGITAILSNTSLRSP